jgi:DNA-directed RNA polymerase specialized sigma24 family protein
MPTTQKASNPLQPRNTMAGDIFVKRYDQLLQWAFRLTRGDREQAEDLLHEAFVQFALRQRDLNVVDNIDAYLYTVLKHLHLASIRRGKRDPLNQMAVVEFDSVDLVLRSTMDGDQVKVQNDLRRICTFLCWRKATTKSASYLILRFFHGYYPEEIMRVALTSRNMVDHGIRLASSEAKVYLADPGRLRVMEARARQNRYEKASPAPSGPIPTPPPYLFVMPAAEFLHVLSEVIFSSRAEECLPIEELLGIYRTPAGAGPLATETSNSSIDRTLLAHLVSCPRCLDSVNSHLQIPPLSDRFPGERLGSFRRTLGKDGSAARGAPKGTVSQMLDQNALQAMQLARSSILRVAQTRLRECFEHQPKRLYIAVNGEVIAMQELASDYNKQSVRLRDRQTLDFIEIFSEQGICLVFISVTSVAHPGPGRLSQKVLLSAGRSLEAILEFTSSDSLLQVVYSDPLLAHSIDFLEAELDQSHRLLADLRTSLEVFSESKAPESFFERLRYRWNEWIETSRPLAIAGGIALLSVVVAAGCLVYWRQQVQKARTLLTEAAEQENGPGKIGDVIHRVMEFDLSSPDGNQPIEQHTVDIWRRPDQSAFALRLSSPDNPLIAGVWKAGDGSSAVYHDHKFFDHTTASAASPPALVRTKTTFLWMDEPSATAFQALAAHPGLVSVTKSGDDSIIDYKPQLEASAAAQPHLVHASLTIRPDRHATGQSFWIESDGQVRHYSYRELSYLERKATPSDDGHFSPDQSLGRGNAVVRRRTISSYSSNPALEVNILYSLHQLGDDVDGQVEIVRGSDGYLTARGTVQSTQQQKQIIQVLARFKTLYGLRVQIHTPQELVNHRAAKQSRSLIDIAPTGPLPIDQRLRAALRRNGVVEEDIAQEEQRVSRGLLDLSDRLHTHAWILKQMAQRFSPAQLQSLDKEALTEWLSLIRDHATSLHLAVAGMNHIMAPLFPPNHLPSPSQPGSMETQTLLADSAAIVNLISDEERTLSQSFVLSPENWRVHDTDPASLWSSLNALDSAATHIVQSATEFTDGLAYLR